MKEIMKINYLVKRKNIKKKLNLLIQWKAWIWKKLKI